MTREEARRLIGWLKCTTNREDDLEAIDMAIEALSADAEPTVIRSKTLLPTKDFKEWAKRVRETNPNVVVIPCDAEVASADAVEVVRCKNCYYAEDDITHMYCVYFGHKVYGDDYCSNAVERREESEVEE